MGDILLFIAMVATIVAVVVAIESWGRHTDHRVVAHFLSLTTTAVGVLLLRGLIEMMATSFTGP